MRFSHAFGVPLSLVWVRMLYVPILIVSAWADTNPVIMDAIKTSLDIVISEDLSNGAIIPHFISQIFAIMSKIEKL